MNRYMRKSFVLFLLVVSLSGGVLLSPKQDMSLPGAPAGAMSLGAGARGGQNLAGPSDLRRYTAGGHVLGFREGGVVIASGSHALRVEFVGSRTVIPVEKGTAAEPEKGRAPELGKVTYPELWDGVTLVYEKTPSSFVKSTYHVEPGETGLSHRVEGIRLRYNVPVKLDPSGNLVMSFATGEMRETRPVAWQEIAGQRVAVESAYRLLGEQEVGFEVATCDPHYPLVIDPVLLWIAYLGPDNDLDCAYGIAQKDGDFYVVGTSGATWGTPIRPFTPGPPLTTNADAFVAKIDANGVLIWNTFLGSDQHDIGTGIACRVGGIYVIGTSGGTWGSPVNPHAGGTDAFVAVLGYGGGLNYSTFLGGPGNDSGQGTDGGVVIGTSSSTWGSPENPFAGGASDIFVASLNAGQIVWNTFLGGARADSGGDIDELYDSSTFSSAYYVVGTFNSNLYWEGEPIGNQCYVAKLIPGSGIVWQSYLGHLYADYGNSIVVDRHGNAYVTGTSAGTWGEQPVRPHSGNGHADAFVAKLDTAGTLQWNTFLGGTDRDVGNDIVASRFDEVIDGYDDIWITGTSEASWGSPDSPYTLWEDAFVARLDGEGVLRSNTFLGTNTIDQGWGIALDGEPPTWGGPVWHPHVAGVYHQEIVASPPPDNIAAPLDGPFNAAFIAKLTDLEVISPQADDVWEISSQHDITWWGATGPVKIEFSWNAGATWITLAVSEDNDGTFPWTVPNTPGWAGLIRVSDAADGDPVDESDGFFHIPWLGVLSPGGAILETGSSVEITWAPFAEPVEILYCTYYDPLYSNDWRSVGPPTTENDGSFIWLVPDTMNDTCAVRIADSTDQDPWDVSNTFMIVGFHVNSPGHSSGGQDLIVGSSHTITWSTWYNNWPMVRIDLSTDNGTTWTAITPPGGITNTGSYDWTVPDMVSSQCLIKVSDPADGFPNDTSDFVFSIVPVPVITVLSPNGSESWEVGSAQTITWSWAGSIAAVKIDYSNDGGAAWTTLELSTDNDGTQPWTVPDTLSSQCLIRIGDASDGIPSDMSDAAFSIVPVPVITVLSPNGGEAWEIGSVHDITWTSVNTGPVKIERSTNNGSTWVTIAASTDNDGVYTWTVPNLAYTQCLIRISEAADGSPIDTSDAVFTMAGFRVTSPAGGAQWTVGSSRTITWDTAGSYPMVMIELSIDNGGTWTTIEASTVNDGSYDWTVPGTISSQCLIRVSDAADGLPSDTTSSFSIVAEAITVNQPWGGSLWAAGTSHAVTWTANTGPVKLEYSYDNGSTWSVIVDSTENDGGYLWVIPYTLSMQCFVRISDAADGSPSDTNNVAFTIGGFRVTSPNGGEQWLIGSQHTITWESVGDWGNVWIEFSTNNGGSWTEIAEGINNDGSYVWTVPDQASSQCLIKVRENIMSGTTHDESDAVFSVGTAFVTVMSPNGGESWQAGSTHNITWTQTGGTGSVTINLRKGGALHETLGTADVTAGTFSWSISPDETLGTDYRVRLYATTFSDVSDADFAIVATAPASRKTDFNGDGQEDILWRYTGGGGYQGWNVVWLMTQGPSPIPLGINQDGTGPTSPLKGSRPGLLLEAALDDTQASRQGIRALSPMGIDTPYQKPKGILRSPMEEGRGGTRGLPSAPTMKDAEMASTASGGEMKIASLGIDSYLYLDTISDLSWEIAGTGDFDGDTDTDILWRNYGAGPFSGWNVIWYMNTAGGITGYGYLSGITDLGWRIVGTGDFDGDGDTDILWRNCGAGDFAGWNVVWYLNGETVDGYGYLTGITDLDWRIVGTGDFDLDGDLDILWRYYGAGDYQGWNAIWYMNGEGIASYGYLSAISDLAWEIAGTGDFNNDGYMDILWRYYGAGGLQGWNCIWYMQGEGIIGYDYPMAIPDTNWRIVNR
jgi:hypothetical protein